MLDRKKGRILCVLCLLLSLLLSGCEDLPAEVPQKKELLIYCGATMAEAVREFADIFEKREGCIVKIMQGGSGNLRRSIHINQVGIYLPGSELYIKQCLAEAGVIEAVVVGVNRAALIVAKGNPLAITPELKNLTSPELRTVLGKSESSSIGRETERMLTAFGNYEAAVNHARYLTSDSRHLQEAICKNKADLTLNWYATSFWKENRESVDVLRLDEAIAPPHPLLIGLLKNSYCPDLARKFMALASSTDGQAIFTRYGFGR